METQNLGINEVEEILIALCATGSSVDKMTQNGLDLNDMGDGISAAMKWPAAIQGADKAVDQGLDIDPAEKARLIEVAKTHITTVSGDVEKVAEAYVEAALNMLYAVGLHLKMNKAQ